jgi:hypothetical protein
MVADSPATHEIQFGRSQALRAASASIAAYRHRQAILSGL